MGGDENEGSVVPVPWEPKAGQSPSRSSLSHRELDILMDGKVKNNIIYDVFRGLKQFLRELFKI